MPTVTIKPVAPVPPPNVVTIELSEYEAAVLLKVFRNISGSFNGPRSITNQIAYTLEKEPSIERRTETLRTEGAVYFKD